jgi:nitroreductase
MVGPEPSADEMERMLTIAARVPDHGKLSPWRFVTVERDQREALAALLHQALEEEDLGATAAHYAKAQQFAHNPGALVVLIAAPVPDHKIPRWEQELSCGAAGMNLLLAAHALGYVGGWITGWAAYSPGVSAAFCSPGERIAGFMFIGHAAMRPIERPRPALAMIARRWSPPPNRQTS